MNTEKIKALGHAFFDGKQLQYLNKNDLEWHDWTCKNQINFDLHEYWRIYPSGYDSDIYKYTTKEFTIRNYYASIYLDAIISSHLSRGLISESGLPFALDEIKVCERAYSMADAMISESEK